MKKDLIELLERDGVNAHLLHLAQDYVTEEHKVPLEAEVVARIPTPECP